MVPLVILPSHAISQAPETIPQPDLPIHETVSQAIPQEDSTAKNQVTRIFEPVWEDGVCTFVLNEAARAADRRRLAEAVEPILHEHRLLTNTEMQENGLIELEPDKMYYFKVPSGRHPGVIRLSAQWLKDHGFLDRLSVLREFYLQKEFRDRLMYLCKKHVSHAWTKRGTAYTMSTTNMKHHGANTIQLGRLLKHADELPGVKKYLIELTSIIAEVTQIAFPDIEKRGRAEKRYENASLTFGAKRNRQFTSVQLNYTEQNASLEGSLKVSGGVHRDVMNDPTLPGALVSMSHHSEDYFTGRFNIRCLHATVPLLPLEIILFSARFYHCSTGGGFYTVPESSPLRVPPPDLTLIPALPPDLEPCRLNLVLYPAIRLMKLFFSEIRIELFSDEVQGLLFEDRAHHYEWMMRTYIVNEPEIMGRLESLPDRIPIPEDGRSRMILANVKTIKKGESRDTRVEFGMGITRNGDPDHYVQLFEFTDPGTGEKQRPDRTEAVKTLDALAKPNVEYEELERDMRYLDPCDYAKNGSPNNLRKSRTRRSARKAQRSHRRKEAWSSSDTEDDTEDDEDECDSELDDADSLIDGKELEDAAEVDGNGEDVASEAAKVLAPGLNDFNAAIDMLKDAGIKLFKFAAQQNELLREANAKISALEKMCQPKLYTEPRKSGLEKNNAAVKDNSTIAVPSSKATEVQPLSSSNKKKRKSETNPAQPNTPQQKSPKRVNKGIFVSHADPVYVDDEEQWEVEKIVGKRPTKSGKPMYKARWKGYSREWDEWMSMKDLENCQELIEEYESRWASVNSNEIE